MANKVWLVRTHRSRISATNLLFASQQRLPLINGKNHCLILFYLFGLSDYLIELKGLSLRRRNHLWLFSFYILLFSSFVFLLALNSISILLTSMETTPLYTYPWSFKKLVRSIIIGLQMINEFIIRIIEFRKRVDIQIHIHSKVKSRKRCIVSMLWYRIKLLSN